MSSLDKVQSPHIHTPCCQQMIKQGIVIAHTQKRSYFSFGSFSVRTNIVYSGVGLALSVVFVFSMVGNVQGSKEVRSSQNEARILLAQLQDEVQHMSWKERLEMDQRLGVDSQLLLAEAADSTDLQVTGRKLVEIPRRLPEVVVAQSGLALASVGNPSRAISPYAQVNLEPELMVVKTMQFTDSSGEMISLLLDREGNLLQVFYP